MTSQERDRLLSLLLDGRRWCQSAEARRADGQAVNYSDPDATAWDLSGAVCHLFGWRRARELFVQIDRQVHVEDGAGPVAGDAAIAAMVGLQRWNDDPGTSHPDLLDLLERLPVISQLSHGEQPVAAAPEDWPDERPEGVPLGPPAGAVGTMPEGSAA